MSYQLTTAKVWDGSAWVPAVGGGGGTLPALTAATVLDGATAIAAAADTTGVDSRGAVTIDSVALGQRHEVRKVTGNQTVSTFVASQWFGPLEDVASAWVVVDGDLTIDSGVVFEPPSRKLFTVVYVTGDLTVNGQVSMTRRGANHSGDSTSGGATTAGAILLASGTYSGVTDPEVPAAGGGGGVGVSSGVNLSGNTGTAGTAGGTGGGGSGGAFGTNATSGAGAAGTCFSGGSGGGGIVVTNSTVATAESGGANGGKGGDAVGIGTFTASDGAGNPAGRFSSANAYLSLNGTGGVLVVICDGTLSGSGSFTANGAPAQSNARCGGASGGGSVTVFYGTDSSTTSVTANGGIAGTSSGGGGFGGAGTARKLAL